MGTQAAKPKPDNIDHHSTHEQPCPNTASLFGSDNDSDSNTQTPTKTTDTPNSTTASKPTSLTPKSQKSGDYVVLARRYRPKRFGDLIGQDILVETIQSSLVQNCMAHAYLLTGIRGVGKTTTARIIAASLNCETLQNTDISAMDANAIEPCLECLQCQSIETGQHLDVTELDAASHTSVDDVRSLIENVRFKPVQGRHKVYIIDEVHMLSKQAFNALLKTLEEPPENVTFILATTEIHKVPVTILSRCQRFVLKRVDTPTLANYMADILAIEGIKATDFALQKMANLSEGSVRDALSMLDQAIALARSALLQKTKNNNADKSANAPDTQPHIDDVIIKDMLGIRDTELHQALFQSIIDNDAPSVIDHSNALRKAGLDPETILKHVCDQCYVLTKACLSEKSLDDQSLSEAEKSWFLGLVPSVDTLRLSVLWQILIKGLDDMKLSYQPAHLLDMVLMRAGLIMNMSASAQPNLGKTPTEVSDAPSLKKKR